MEKTKDQLLMEKLRKAAHRMRGGGGMGGPHRHGGPHGPCGHRGGPPHCGPGPHARPTFPREWILLRLLEAEDGGSRQKDIADALGIRPSSLSEQIDRLEAERYLERSVNPDDRRSTLITLTEKGRARAYEVTDERQKRAADFCAGLTEEEKDTLILLLDKLLAETPPAEA